MTVAPHLSVFTEKNSPFRLVEIGIIFMVGQASGITGEISGVYFGTNPGNLSLMSGTTNWSTNINTASIEGSNMVLYFIAAHNSGNRATNILTNHIDATGPAITFGLDYTTGLLAGSTNFQGTITEHGSVVLGGRLEITNTNYNETYSISGASSAWQVNIDTKNYVSGDYDIILSATNNLGMTSVITQSGVYISNNNSWYHDWEYRIAISNSLACGADLTNFPVLIYLSNNSDVQNHVTEDGGDIVFTSYDKYTKLDHEIEYINKTAGTLCAWVKMSEMSGTDEGKNIIYMYFDSSMADSNFQNPQGVWSSGYEGVYHLIETGGDASNSVMNSRHAVNHMADLPSASGKPNGTLNTNGAIGSGGFFYSNDYLDMGKFINEGSISISTWFYLPSDIWYDRGSAAQFFTARYYGQTGTGIWATTTGGRLRNSVHNGSAHNTDTVLNPTSPAFLTNRWNHSCITFDGSLMRTYVNGVLGGEIITNNPLGQTNNSWHIGDSGNAAGGASQSGTYGLLDEIQISGVARSAGWIATHYLNIANPLGFSGISGSESSPESAPVVSITMPADNVWINASTITFSGTADAGNGTLAGVYFGTAISSLALVSGTTVWNTNVNVISLAGTTNIFYAVASNNDGICATNMQTNRIDLTAPSSTFAVAFQNAHLQGITNIAGTFYDNFAALTGACLEVTNAVSSRIFGISTSQTNWTNQITVSDFIPGYYEFHLYVTNEAGLVSVLTQTNVLLSNESVSSPAAVEISILPASINSNQLFNIIVSNDNTNASMVHYVYVITNNVTNEFVNPAGNTTNIIIALRENYTNIIAAFVTNSMGIWSEIKTNTYIIDTVKPDMPANNYVYADGGIYTNTMDRYYTNYANDNMSSVTLYLKTNTGAFFIADVLDLVQDGQYTISAYAVDSVGNVSATNTHTLLLDKTAPQISFDLDYNNGTISRSSNITGTMHDSLLPVTGGKLVVTNNICSYEYPIAAVSTNWTNALDISLYPDGYYSFVFSATNEAGLASIITQTNILIAKIPSAISLISPTNNARIFGITAMSGIVTPGSFGPSNVFMRTNYGPLMPLTLSGLTWSTNYNTADLADGQHLFTFVVVSTNNLTNTNNAYLTIDNTAPVFTASSPADNEGNVSRYSSVSIFFSEPMAADASGYIVLSNSNSGAVITGSWVRNNGSNLVFTPGAAMGGANEKIIVNILGGAKDLAGNNLGADTIFSFTLLANTPPVISINSPGNLAFLNAGMMISGVCSDSEDNIVSNVCTWDNWATCSITENLSNWSVSAAGMPEGTNLFQIKSYDNSGEVSSIVSRYFIIDTVAPAILLPANFTTNMYFENKTNFTISFSDINLTSYLYRYGAGEYTSVTNSTSLALSFDKSGVYNLDLKSRDQAGNESRLGLAFTFDISLVNLDGLSDSARKWAKKIKDEDLAHQIGSIKSRENGIPVIEYLVKQTADRGAAATIVSKRNDDVLIVCKHNNGIAEEKPKKVTVYDRTGRIIRQLDPAGMRDTIMVWDKKDRSGRLVNDGIYFLIVEYPGARSSIPVVIMNKIK
ncbi:MAG: hypothetical protein A2096_13895 [Spirochaetes bacterium GWF1_41_5]|nr:MAG: hypothetical protein A2096_13895 [Spirochaetes bacterium GWF1_41_5]